MKLKEKIVFIARRIVIRKRTTKLIDKSKRNIKLSREQKKEYSAFWKRYYKHPSLVWVKFYTKMYGKFDKRFVPEDYFYAYINRIINERKFASYASDKNKFDLIFAGFKQPNTIGRKVNGIYFDKNYLPISVDGIINNAKKCKIGVIAKPARDSSQGNGISAFFVDDKDFCIELKTFLESHKKDVIVQEIISNQHKVFKELNPTTINTTRIMSYIDDYGNVHILSRYTRFGSSKAQIVDNTHQGGGRCVFDENGQFRSYGLDSNYEKISANFDNKQLSLFSIDKKIIEGIDDFVKKLHCRVPNFRIVSWDICVLDDGMPCFIEMNVNNPAFNAHQIFNGPIFKDFSEEILERSKL